MAIDQHDMSGSDEDNEQPYEPTLEEEHSGFSWDPAPQSHAGSSLPRTMPVRDHDTLLQKIMRPIPAAALGVGLVLGFIVRGFFGGGDEAPVVKPTKVTDTAYQSEPAKTVSAPAEKRVDILGTSETPSTSKSPIVVPKIAKKNVSKAGKRFVQSIKLSSKGSYAIANIGTGGYKFKYRSQVVTKPYRVVVDLEGLNGTQTKNKVVASKKMRPIKQVRLERRTANKVRVVFDLSTSKKPRYSINRTSTGLRVSIRK